MGDVEGDGFTSSAPAEDFWVCDRCFGDQDIQAFIRQEAEVGFCDFCNRRSRRTPIVAPLPAVVDFMLEAINREYEHAVEALGWESREGGYQGLHWDSYDLLMDQLELDLPNDADDHLFNVLVECLGDEPWCEKNPYALRPADRLITSWRRFCDFIKHERRYFFIRSSRDPDNDELLNPSRLLRLIGRAATDNDLVTTLKAGARIYRARNFRRGEALRTGCDFGPPPLKHAMLPNRMSPAGVVMFYCGDSPATAIAEGDRYPQKGLAVGTFRLQKDIRLLDLTSLRRPLRFFEPQSDNDTANRDEIAFLNSFLRDVAKPLLPGANEHIEYVPTQVVTEWFRSEFRYLREPINGIRYGGGIDGVETNGINHDGFLLVVSRWGFALGQAKIRAARNRQARAAGLERGMW